MTCSDRKGLFRMPDTLPISATLLELAPKFLRYAQIELGFAQESVIKYEDCLRQISKIIGNRPADSYTLEDVLELKATLLRNHRSVARQVSLLSALKRFLEFCRNQEKLPALDPVSITVPKRPRREVIYLTVDEVERFVNAIQLTNLDDKPSMPSRLGCTAKSSTCLIFKKFLSDDWTVALHRR